MAFEQVEPKVPSAIGDISITLTDHIAIAGPGGGPVDAWQEIGFNVQVLNGDGQIMRTVSGNLAPHLTQPQIDQLKAFVATIRAKAEAEILP